MVMASVTILFFDLAGIEEFWIIKMKLNSEKLFLFGVNPLRIQLPLDFPNYQIQQFNNQIYLTAPSLSNFKDNKAEKTRLWNCLKQIFEL